MRRTRIGLLFLGVIALVMAPISAHAAPGYLTSDPGNNDKMSNAPDDVNVVFDQPLEPGGSLIVVDDCGKRIDDNSPVVVGSTISVGIAKTPSGVYTAMWKVRAPGGVGGGDATGQIEFTVTSGKSCGPKPDDHSGHGGGGDHSGHEGGGGGDHSGHEGGGGHSSGGVGHPGHTDGVDHSGHVSAVDHSAHERASGKKSPSNEPEEAGPPIDAPPASDGTAPLAGGLTDPGEVPGSMVLTALSMCLLLGAAGGWVVRNLTPK